MKRSPLKRSPFKTTRRRLKVKSKSKAAKLFRWSRMVRGRDWFTCRRCGGPGEHAHHIAPRSRRPDLKFSMDNGMTVCADCHLWIHSHPKEATAAGFLSDEKYEVRAA
jgi:5-methylcytosine-specific restriction endonuclease McrA